ncbi:NEDD8-activating enzyme E1 regulatory subunit [Klebsormidium nitens]|uniref:NEDD8-activating enzyme E1 regulatory subunit n=1 Tax=Klebsormidium nitens TaxID=105231 RepID=A0A1Y1HR69_KLENI|nr:NEDD8-activating enzyme E1 regulatory subunit [Klebsormidium nitens]|eukprot:GAQ81120.1 NEDD8-activating enzyme E1 regulatory subunit [Klebsormidium nitens]
MAQKKQKYDRQLRIWGEHGQEALENAKVCLLNCGPTGSEALKNLVLGGIGSFTIVDGKKVEPSDLGNNFLLDHDSLGSSRAKTATSLLQELNDTVDAQFVEESPEALLNSNPGFFGDFTLVIATQLTESALLKLDKICREHSVTLLVARSYGLAGLVRISTEEHTVIESKPDSAVEDLRFHCPWPALTEYAADFDIDTKDPLTHKHIPYGIILLKVTEEWKASHDGKLPANSKERAEFKEAIKARTNPLEEEENYKEALAAAFKVWSPPSISSELRTVLDDRAAETLDAKSPVFWILVAALNAFVKGEGAGELPLEGSIPDMTSFTESYVGLQRVYQEKALSDAAAVEGHVRRLLKKLGREPASISPPTVKHFCKNARNLRVLRYRPLAEEYGAVGNKKGELQSLLGSEDNSHAALYLLLRGADHFAATYNRFPGVFDSELEEDVSRLKAVAGGLLNEGGSGAALPDDYVTEVCRFGAGHQADHEAVCTTVGNVPLQRDGILIGCAKPLTIVDAPLFGETPRESKRNALNFMLGRKRNVACVSHENERDSLEMSDASLRSHLSEVFPGRRRD